MPNKSKKQSVITQVYALPSNEAARKKFLDGVNSLAESCKAEWVAGSNYDEMSYLEEIEKELASHIGDSGVEELRQKFERQSR